MKICYIFPSALPSKNASSLQTAKMCDAFSNKNKIILYLPNTGYKNISIKKFYNLKNNFKVVRLKNFNKFPVGFDYYLFSLFAIIKSLKFRPNFYITRMFIVSFFLILFKKKHVLEVHNDMSIEGRVVKFIFKYFNIFNSKYIIKIVTTTHTLKQHYSKKYKIPNKKFQVLPNGSSFMRQKFKPKKKVRNIGYFGALYMSRGLDIIIYLSKIFKGLNFYIYGGDKEDVLKLKKYYHSKNLIFKPYINQKALELKMKKMDVLLLPYTTKITVAGDVGNMKKYTSPLKMFDYLASGKIIVSSNIHVLHEILQDEYNCFMVKNYLNKNSWVKKFKKILSNPVKRNQIALNALNSSRQYDTKKRSERIVSFFKNESVI